MAHLLVFSVALGLRGICIFELSSSPGFEVPFLDEERYWQLALKLNDGESLGEELHWQATLYPWLLSVLVGMLGKSPWAIKLVQVVLSAATSSLVLELGRRTLSTRRGIVAGLFFACYGPAIFYSTQLVATTLATFLGAALLLCATLQRQSSGSVVGALVLGALGGICLLTRPTFAPFLVVLLALSFLVWRRKANLKRAVGLSLAVVMAFALVIAPAAFHRKEVTGEFSVLPISGPLNLYIGNADQSCELLNTRGHDWRRLVESPFVDSNLSRDEWTDAAAARHFESLVLSRFLKNPTSSFTGFMNKLTQTLSSRELPRNVDPYLYRSHSVVLQLTYWTIGPVGFPLIVVFPLAAFAAAHRRSRAQLGLAVVFFVVYAASLALVFIATRYRIVLMPVVCLLAAQGLAELIQTRARALTQNRTATAAAVVVTILAVHPFGVCAQQVNFEAEYEQIVGSYFMRQGDLGRAGAHLKRSHDLDPENIITLYNLGHWYAANKRSERAIETWREAVRVTADHDGARRSLGALLLQRGALQEAHSHLDKISDSKVMDANEFANIGLAMLKNGQSNEARMFLESAVRRDCTLLDAYAALSQVQASGGDRPLALRTLEKATAFHPQSAMLHVGIARLQLLQGETEAATRAIKAALAAEPAHREAAQLLAEIYKR